MTEIEKIPSAVWDEVLSRGITRENTVLCARSDKNGEGVYCDNWIFVSDSEIALVGGINLIVPKDGVKRSDRERLAVKIGNVSYDNIPLEGLSDFKVEKLISGCILTAAEKDGSYKAITMLSCDCERELGTFCKCMNQYVKDGKIDDLHEDTDELFCPKCGRRYPDPARKVCPKCMDRTGIIKRIWSFMKKYRTSIMLIFVALAMVSALSIVAPYVSSGFFYDKVLTEGGSFYGQVLLVIGIIIALRLGSMLVNMVSNIITAHIVPKIVYDLKKTIFGAVERLSVSFFTNRQTGALMNQVNGDANSIYWFFVDGFPYLVMNIIQTVAVLAVMFVIDWRMTLVALAFCPVVVVCVKRLFRRMSRLYAKRYSDTRSMNGLLAGVLGAARVVKAFARENDEIKRFGGKNEKLAKSSQAATIYNGTVFPAVTFMFVISSLLITALCGWQVIEGEMTYGTMLTFGAYASMLYSPLMFFVNFTNSITDCFNAMYRLIEVMDAEPDVRESENATELESIEGRVTFEDVSFGYDKTRNVIENVSFDIAPGKKIGIVGHTGAGKSTIANLLIRLYDPTEGRILIDGHDIKTLSFDTVRRSIAIVSQETYLFHGSILDNIRYAKPEATMEEIVTASKISGAHDFIVKLDDGYNTRIGWGFKELSGGERQRVSIARAILRDPKILIMDEATSAMDTRTERAIQSALEKLCRERTTVMIAHRLSTLRDADSLMVIEHGKVAESGTHKELFCKKEIYYKLYTLQYEALKNAGIEE